MRTPPTAFVNARIVDPESGYDGPGCVVVAEGVIADVQRRPQLDAGSAEMKVVDAAGALLCPGLIDLRGMTGEPGAESAETLASASRAAAAGGVTTIVVQPDTSPAIDEPAMVDFIPRRAPDVEMVHVHVAGRSEEHTSELQSH